MKVLVARLADFRPNDRVIIEADRRSIGVFRIGGEFFAVRNRCPHMGGPLCLGTVANAIESDLPGDVRSVENKYLLACPWHGWEYDLATGQSYANDVRRVRPYPVLVQSSGQGDPVQQPEEARHEPDRGLSIRPGPYVIETFPVSIEDDYVVVEIPG